MRRLFLAEPIAGQMTISGSDAHHLLHVMRAKIGDKLVVVGSDSRVAEAEIVSILADSAQVKFLQELENTTDSPVEIILAQCLPKAAKMEFIVQKAVELGASMVVPLKSQNCVVRYDEGKAASKQAKWQKVADEAAKQCGRTRRLQVEAVKTLSDFAAWASDADIKVLFCYEEEDSCTIGQALSAAGECTGYGVLIGPEGGFTPEEAAMIKAKGGQAVTLGPRILRAETAALAALAVVQYEKGDLGNR